MKTTQQGADQLETESVCVLTRACVCVVLFFFWGGGYFFADTQEGIPRTALLITSGDHRTSATAWNTNALWDIVLEIGFYYSC